MNAVVLTDKQQHAAQVIEHWRQHPADFVRDVFKLEPYPWQVDVLEQFPHNPRQAMAAAKGVGKTAVMAWLGWNFLVCYGPSSKGVAISITGTNLKAGLWAELAAWRSRAPLLQHQFDMTSERISHRDADRFPEWFMVAASFAKSANDQEVGSTLAGKWAKNVLFLIDEAGEVPVALLRVAEAALQREGTSGHILMAGNTTSRNGALYEAAYTHRAQWGVHEVTGDPDDPKRSPVVNIEYAREQIRIYGRDNPWVMINILAKFPLTGLNKLLPDDVARACIGRHVPLKAYDWAPRIFGGDIALFGDDLTVGFPRQGRVAFKPIVLRQQDPLQVAGHFMEHCKQWNADSIQLDVTGGYGAGTASAMRQFGALVTDVQFAGKPRDPRFFNVRAEIIWLLAEWFKTEPSIPDVPELVEEISGVEYGYKGDKLVIEPKAEMKVRLGRSPDYMDALACTFCHPIAPRGRQALELEAMFDIYSSVGKSKTDYDPLARE